MIKVEAYYALNWRPKNGSLIAALSSGIAICPSGVMVLSEVAWVRLMMVFGGGSSPMSFADCAAEATSQPFLRDRSTSVPSGFRFPPVRRKLSSGSHLLCPLIIASRFPECQHEHCNLTRGGNSGFAESAPPSQPNRPGLQRREALDLSDDTGRRFEQ